MEILAYVLVYVVSGLSLVGSGFIVWLSLKTNRETKRQAEAIAELHRRVDGGRRVDDSLTPAQRQRLWSAGLKAEATTYRDALARGEY